MMAVKPYDYAVFIGRFQPFHNGHQHVIREALKIARNVLVLVGSSNVGRTTRNPFNYAERETMIRQGIMDTRLSIAPLPDCGYNDQEWIEQVQHAVRAHTAGCVQPTITLVGCDKDASTYYLRMFPQWAWTEFQHATMNATTVREEFFLPGADLPQDILDVIPDTTLDALNRFRGNPAFQTLMEEHAFFQKYRQEWGLGPFVTVDACVIQSGHVLLVERGEMPGKGKLALPGGFLNRDESLFQGCLRELAEETGWEIGEAVARAYLRARETFDDPHRSQRGRIITTAFLFELPPGPLQPVKGMDDAADAKWVELSALRVEDLFDDHAFIIRHLLGKRK